MKTVQEFYCEYLRTNTAYSDDQRCSEWAGKFAVAYAEHVRDECARIAKEGYYNVRPANLIYLEIRKLEIK